MFHWGLFFYLRSIRFGGLELFVCSVRVLLGQSSTNSVAGAAVCIIINYLVMCKLFLVGSQSFLSVLYSLVTGDTNYRDLAECLERLAVSAKVATVLTVLGSIPASSENSGFWGWQMKQCWITYIKSRISPFKNITEKQFQVLFVFLHVRPK